MEREPATTRHPTTPRPHPVRRPDMSDFEAISRALAEYSDGEALLATGLDRGLIGTAEGWFGHERRVVALYDLSICVRVLQEEWGMDEEEADEWIAHNLTAAYVGPGTPVFAVIMRQPTVVAPDE